MNTFLKYNILSILLLVASKGISQINLVPNPSFENVNCSGLTTGLSQIAKAIPWQMPTLGHPDYFNSCVLDIKFQTPTNSLGFQYPKTGVAYIGFSPFVIGNTDYREYAQVKLDSILKPCVDYFVSFYINKANSVPYAVSTIGAYLSNTAISRSDYSNFTYKPQINSDSTKPIVDTTSWVKISGVYNAKGGEQYLTIGNFSDDLHTKLDSFPPYQNSNMPMAYYFLDDVSVTEQPIVRKANAGNDASICEGASVKIGTILDTTGIKVSWQPTIGLNSNVIPQPLASPISTTTYTLTLTYNCGNTSIDTVTVQVNNPSATISAAKINLCPGETGTATAKISNAVGPYTFTWSNGNSSIEPVEMQVSGLVAGNYIVTIADALGCTATSGVTFINISAPTASISAAETTITEGEQITLNGSGGVSYLWSPAATLSCNTCQNPAALPSTTTIYTLTVTAANGCTDTSDVTVKVNPLCLDEKTIFIPNIFSPNNDGKNDVLAIEGNGLTNIYLGIYDRWGNLVFETYDNIHSWDGTKKGNPVEVGVYSYYLRGTCVKTHGVVTLKGNVTLVK
ncbi:MAG: gliding motility-associated C-terminal domain-containing protein [Bacteroidia bacterium]|nr:gliding motility-associated C-terminal domain-containing protein [Bacteroidia bacterium]